MLYTYDHNNKQNGTNLSRFTLKNLYFRHDYLLHMVRMLLIRNSSSTKFSSQQFSKFIGSPIPACFTNFPTMTCIFLVTMSIVKYKNLPVYLRTLLTCEDDSLHIHFAFFPIFKGSRKYNSNVCVFFLNLNHFEFNLNLHKQVNKLLSVRNKYLFKQILVAVNFC